MAFRRVFLHGAGRRGADAWPHADPAGGDFVTFAEGSSVAGQAESLVRHFSGDPALVFAHSIGAVPAVLAARRLRVAGLVLVEPALYDIARGHEAIERHIAIVTEARTLSESGDLRGFWAILRPLMFGGPYDAAAWEKEQRVAERWARTNLPWGHGVRPEMLAGIRTLVVTGGWNEEYETIAKALVSGGAEHVIADGAGHRAQDAEGFAPAVHEFESTLT
ncbi:alpha/beta fold hydrolase [Microbacterium sp.]|uniref:alpha/beta fold hydrolase n=1 Tax=Microbacterium sp. TaxID=51671 RepID=UPI002811343C|nr:alpha/beta fold hydrolase [Microbacterium sp.]